MIERIKRRAGDRGATLVEYALVFALVAVVILGAADFLTKESSAEIDNQAECVSQRPPPPECLIPAITTTTTIVPPSITVTTVPPPPPATPQLSIDGAARKSVDPAPRWLEVDVEVVVEQPPDLGGGYVPVQGTTVRAEVLLVDPTDPLVYLPDPWYINCVTNSSGQCTLRFDLPYTDVTEVWLEITGTDGVPPADLVGPMVVNPTWP